MSDADERKRKELSQKIMSAFFCLEGVVLTLAFIGGLIIYFIKG